MAGLGGGSSDGAVALAGLNRVWDLRRSSRDLMALASELGADVPFFLVGGSALGAGRGDELYPLDDIAEFGVLIIKPSFGVSTADAYRWCDEDRAASAVEVGAHPGRRPLDVGWASGPVALMNDLEGPVARRHPEIREMVEACQREGAVAAGMTGSGSAVFGLFSQAAASRAARRLRRPDWLVLIARTLTRREARRRVSL
jgi:4-diphosphocytidyl-2-C-methyl-D-erythritol kinase